MKNFILFLMIFSSFLYGDQNDYFVASFDPFNEVSTTAIPVTDFWWPWSSTNENAFSEIVKRSRKLAYDYYMKNNGAATDMIAMGLIKAENANLGEKLDFQMVIVSYYDGSKYYEGFSHACVANSQYTPSEEKWKEMMEKAKDMATLSYHMQN